MDSTRVGGAGEASPGPWPGQQHGTAITANDNVVPQAA